MPKKLLNWPAAAVEATAKKYNISASEVRQQVRSYLAAQEYPDHPDSVAIIREFEATYNLED